MLDDISPKKFHRKALENAHAALFVAWAEAVFGEEMVDDTTDKSTDKSTDKHKVTSMVMAHAFEGEKALSQLTVAAGEFVELLNTHIATGWSWVRSSDGAEGYVPEGYLESA